MRRRIGARDVGRLEQGATAIANARINSSQTVRFAKGGVLAFAPSAAIDFYASYTSTSGFINVSNEFLALSAKSQSGNAVAVGAGMLAVSAVGAVGAPAMLLALGVGYDFSQPAPTRLVSLAAFTGMLMLTRRSYMFTVVAFFLLYGHRMRTRSR